jgi:2-phosphosulfolactate phosphatase
MPLIAEDAAQHGFAYRFGWGAEGLEALAADCSVIVVVDVLRFTTAVSVVVAAGSIVFPYRWCDEGAAAAAAQRGAVLAGRRREGPVSLSPTDLMTLPTGSRIVLPSPDGSTLSLRASELGTTFVLAGSLRNATATAERARTLASRAPIGVIAAGERWPGSSAPLRPSVEDMLGAGAILAALDPAGAVSAPGCSPEAAAARAAFVDARPSLVDRVCGSASGRQLIRIGCADDVANAAQLDASTVAAQLIDDAFVPG